MTPLLWITLAMALPALALFLPLKGARKYAYTPPRKRFHEADAVLSRRLLQPGSEAYERYYAQRPKFKEADDRSRRSPGLLSPDSRYYNPATFSAAKANFQVIDHLASLIDGPVAHRQQGTHQPLENTRFATRWLKQGGAHSVGCCTLQDYHLYSHKGRGGRAGEAISKKHRYAIALTVEMDHGMMQSAPLGTAVMESSEQYLRSGILAIKLAARIRQMGYEARAHIDGNYEVICPLVAVDAGLGVIGRMGLLMTPRLGPRVRIAVVSTNMPLIPSAAVPERTTLHFCDLCKKCAHNCPVAAIPTDGPKELQGVRRWQINSERCYHMWTVGGTDCGRCMAVCPFSHRDNAIHGFIRWGIKNNLLFRHVALKLDDVFYGRKPRIRPLPPWTGTRERP